MIEQKTIKLSKVSMNKDNPRVFTKANISDIIRSLLTFPEMLHGIRAIAIKDNVVLGGNLRLKGLKSILDLSIEEIATIIADNSKDKSEKRISYLVDYWTEFKANKEMNFIIADSLTDAQAKEFLIRDNVSTGGWDMDMLANNWDSEELNDWGVNVWMPEEESEVKEKEESDKSIEETTKELPQAIKNILIDKMKLFVCENTNVSLANMFTNKYEFQRAFAFAKTTGSSIPGYYTLAYTPDRINTAGDKYTLKEFVALDGIVDRIDFNTSGSFKLDFIAKNQLPMKGYKIPAEFPINKALSLYSEYCDENSKILDPCHGWGGRITAFMLSNAKTYVGFDTNKSSCDGVNSLFDDVKCFCEPYKNSNIVNDMFENAMNYYECNSFDFAFTSPPYFDVEKYDGENSSRKKHSNYESWRDGFYTTLIKNVYNLIKPGKFFCLNVGSQKYPLAKDAMSIAATIGFEFVSIDNSFIKGLNMGESDNNDNGEVLITFRKQL